MKKLPNNFNTYIRKFSGDSSGFTLLELTIVVLLLALVMTLGFTFYFFSIFAFEVGEKQTDVQQNARLVADFISKELRVAERIIVIDEYKGELKELDLTDLETDLLIDDIDDPDGTFHVYFIFLQDNAIYYQEVDGSDQPAVMLEGISQEIDFDLSFRKGETKDNLLKFNVSATRKEDGRTFNLDSEVLALNLDTIEDELLSEVEGTAIVYQVPAPHPSIKEISFEPSSFDYNEDGKTVKATVKTEDVSDGRIVSLELDRLFHGGTTSPVTSFTLDPEEPVIENDQAIFEIIYDSDVYFGDYIAYVSVESVPFPGRRLFFISPVIDLFEARAIHGDSGHVEITIETIGVDPDEDTEVVITMDPMVEGDDLFIAFVKEEGDEYIFVDFSFHDGSPQDRLQEDGTVRFWVELDMSVGDLIGGNYFFLTRIGRIDWVEEPYMQVNPYLSDLAVWKDYDEENPDPEKELDLDFEKEVYSYDVTVDADLDSIDVIATLDDEENAYLKINGDSYDSGDPVTIDNLDKDITVTVTAGDGDQERTREYTITVIQ